jgi:hypothetical protein
MQNMNGRSGDQVLGLARAEPRPSDDGVSHRVAPTDDQSADSGGGIGVIPWATAAHEERP